MISGTVQTVWVVSRPGQPIVDGVFDSVIEAEQYRKEDPSREVHNRSGLVTDDGRVFLLEPWGPYELRKTSPCS